LISDELMNSKPSLDLNLDQLDTYRKQGGDLSGFLVGNDFPTFAGPWSTSYATSRNLKENQLSIIN